MSPPAPSNDMPRQKRRGGGGVAHRTHTRHRPISHRTLAPCGWQVLSAGPLTGASRHSGGLARGHARDPSRGALRRGMGAHAAAGAGEGGAREAAAASGGPGGGGGGAALPAALRLLDRPAALGTAEPQATHRRCRRARRAALVARARGRGRAAAAHAAAHRAARPAARHGGGGARCARECGARGSRGAREGRADAGLARRGPARHRQVERGGGGAGVPTQAALGRGAHAGARGHWARGRPAGGKVGVEERGGEAQGRL